MLGVFYYPWFGNATNPIEKWRQWNKEGHNPPQTWASKYLPDVSGAGATTEQRLYDSFDIDVINRQMKLIKDCGIDTVIWSWMGSTTFSEKTMSNWWTKGTNPTGLKHCIYYERLWYIPEQTEQYHINEVNYVKSKYAKDSRYLKINNKPAVFVYSRKPPERDNVDATAYQIDLIKKWGKVRAATGVWLSLKTMLGDGWMNYKSNADSWHQYKPTVNYVKAVPYSSTVSVGFWRLNESTPRLARDTNRWKNDLIKMKNDGYPINLICTWNEWGEGTGIEPASIGTGASYGNTYTNIVNNVF